MIRFKEKEFQQWSICPATGDIFDEETGEVQIVKMHKDRPHFKGMHFSTETKAKISAALKLA